jgi:hypothetical protein
MILFGFITVAMLQNVAVSAAAATVTGAISLGIKYLYSKISGKKEQEVSK